MPAWRADASGTSGVTTVQAGTNVNAISVSGGTTATATLSAHANLEAIADGDAITGTLRTQILQANTVIADYISADSIDATHLKVSNDAAGSAGIYMDGVNNRIDIRDSSALRVRIGSLS